MLADEDRMYLYTGKKLKEPTKFNSIDVVFVCVYLDLLQNLTIQGSDFGILSAFLVNWFGSSVHKGGIC